MQFNYYFLKHLSASLHQGLYQSKIDVIFSQNKNELILSFLTKTSPFYIKANLEGEISLLSFPDSFARARKNSINLFEEIQDLTVEKVKQFENERAFSIQLCNNYELVFKLYGRNSNIILFHKQQVSSIFKKGYGQDLELNLNTFNIPIDQSDQAIIQSEFNLQSVFPTFDKNIKSYLKSIGFFALENTTSKLELLHHTLNQIDGRNFYIIEKDELPKLTLLLQTDFISLVHDPIEACNLLATKFYAKYQFLKQKGKQLTSLTKEIKKCNSYLRISSEKLKMIKNLRKQDELANILMANLHLQIAMGCKEIELDDFYTNNRIKIKLKPNLSLQQNAAIRYKKAKNKSKEIENLDSNIQLKSALLKKLNQKKIEIEGIKDPKLYKVLEKNSDKSVQKKEQVPFNEQVIDGFRVWIGKNAKNNDLLTQRFAKKNDLWLHARDVSGSHVVIRNPEDVKIPLSTIEKVAQLAAWNSKRKSDTLAPVIYTQKKYVRKPKGSHPGQVIITKEEVILVTPKREASLG